MFKKYLLRFIYFGIGLYVLICALLYFAQEQLLFFPTKLESNYKFSFSKPFEEVFIKTKDQKKLHGLLFKAASSKGLIFYLHGNAGDLSSWGKIASVYTAMNYDIFMLDYRGYGKSEGSISNEQQLFEDHQLVYNALKQKYDESKIVILGYSIGSGFAAQLASQNHPRLLILQAPYYSISDMMHHKYPFVPKFLLKYKLATNLYLPKCKMPIVLFHGDKDKVIYYGSSLKLKKHLKPNDTLITLRNQSHNQFTDNWDYLKVMDSLLK